MSNTNTQESNVKFWWKIAQKYYMEKALENIRNNG